MIELEFRIRTEALYGRAHAQKHTANTVTARADDHDRAMESPDSNALRDQRRDQHADKHDPASVSAQSRADGRAGQADQYAEQYVEAARTGWEETRQAYFNAVFSSAPDLAAAHAPAVAPGLGRSLALLIRSLERDDDTPVEGSTTMPVQHERKNRDCLTCEMP